MANRNDKDIRRTELLPDPDELYFDDDLDTVTRGLPTESDYLPEEDEAEQAPLAPTEGIGRIGVRMVGLGSVPDEGHATEADEAYGADDEYAEADEAVETVYAAPRSGYEAGDDAEEYLTPRQRARRESMNARAQAIPTPGTQRRKQQRVVMDEESVKAKHPKLRIFIMTAVTVVLLGFIGLMLLGYTMMAGMETIPEGIVSSTVGTAQTGFSRVTEFVADYFRRIKLRSNLEEEYLKVVALNEELAVKAAFAAEYERRLAQYEAIDAEMTRGDNELLNPLCCQVIGREQGNYFSVFTIDQGSRNGIEEYMAVMAVTNDGALVGYTEKVYETTATVRTIIDSGASIAGLIQSSRDQGTVRGTLGVDGTPMCRMYYLPDAHQPRPGDIVVTSGIGMSFPKGLPIGTVRESTRGMEDKPM